MANYAVPVSSYLSEDRITAFYNSHLGYPGRAVPVSLFNGHKHGGLGERPDAADFVICLKDGGGAINPRPALALEVDEQHSNVRIRQNISKTVVQAIATVVGENELFLVDDPDRWRWCPISIVCTPPETCITVPIPTCCRDKKEGLGFNEFSKPDRYYWPHH